MANNIDDLGRVVRPFGGASSSSQGGDLVEYDDDDEWSLCDFVHHDKKGEMLFWGGGPCLKGEHGLFCLFAYLFSCF